VAKGRVRWSAPAEKDFAAARRFLTLICPAAHAARLVRGMRHARPVTHAAKDLLRAGALVLLSQDDAQVAADLKRIRKGKPLAPVLLVQGDLVHGTVLIVADGYHRICAACHFDEDAPISCLLAPR
jgi:hypothetical protein